MKDKQPSILSEDEFMLSGKEGVKTAPIVYIAGPYRSNTVTGKIRNIMKARKVARALWRLGFPTICPHSNSAFIDDIDDIILPGCIRLMERSDVIYLLQGWEKSKGTLAELEIAEKHGMHVYSKLRHLLLDFNKGLI